eukprot:TRINITY_DN5459_c0_g2_i1.p1 TRINITY_DN5459_c0_g2~~TRINITY_DN5459_c0_g2_i1.p1  ORF type:complete len:217 (+),score=50.47 TRINITY_DN5459_c0_g2_i1:47-697(+)
MASTTRHDELSQELKQLAGFVTSVAAEFARMNQSDSIQSMLSVTKELIALERNIQQQKTQQTKKIEAIRSMGHDGDIDSLLQQVTQQIPLANTDPSQHPFIINLMKEVQRNKPHDAPTDDDIESVGEISTHRCPLSLTLLVEPMKNVDCGHHYNKAAIENHLRQKAFVDCPVSGCNARVTRDSLVFDHEKQRRVQMDAANTRPRYNEDDVEDLDVL